VASMSTDGRFGREARTGARVAACAMREGAP
jgi:hypothetical protein